MPAFITKSRSKGRQSSEAELVEAENPNQHHNRLARIVSGINQLDAEARHEVEKEDNIPSSTPESTLSSVEPPRRKLISWKDGDPENPYNWSSKYKAWIVFIGMMVVVNSTLGSSLPSNAIPFIAKDFEITSQQAEILPISMYLIGYIVGPLVFGPLSETYGRQLIMTTSFVVYTIFTMACALAPTWAALLIFRLLCGIMASSPISVVGGLYADIYGDPVTRGRAMAVFIGGTCVGPLVSPLTSGFISPVKGWRWTFWIGLMLAGVTLPIVLALPETYGPILLAHRAQKIRKETGNHNLFAAIELEKKGWKQMATVTLTRPLRMIAFELIVLATCLYLSLAYGIFYMYFEAYPIIFSGIYGQSPGVSGLMFLPIGAGTVGAIALFLWYDSFLRKAQKAGKAWTQKEESRRLPLACLGGPLYVIALFWLGWTSRPDIHFLVPMLAGIPFGMGFILIFMALLNYLTDAYEVFAASAMGASSGCRSIAGAVLPFAATPMYTKLGVPWASSLLAFLSLGMCVVPFGFLWKGDVLRARSGFCKELKERKAKEREELERWRTREGEGEGGEGNGAGVGEKI